MRLYAHDTVPAFDRSTVPLATATVRIKPDRVVFYSFDRHRRWPKY